LRRDYPLILMTLPVIILLAVFAYIPIAANAIAFQFYEPYLGTNFFDCMSQSAWTGLENFERMMDDPEFWNAVQNTLVFSILQLIFPIPIALALALLINSFLRSKVRAWSQAILSPFVQRHFTKGMLIGAIQG
jgi:putative aldouronate transport system permease protein